MSWQVGIVICGIIIVNLLLWLLAMPRYVSRRLSSFHKEMVNRHYDEVESMYRQMRGWRHDYHNHIQSLKAYMALGQYEELSEFLNRLEEDLAKVDTLIKSGNATVDAILNSKLSLIQEKRIPVDATAIVPEDIPIEGIDLSVLIGNLLDNAIEACTQLPAKEQFIRIYIDIVKKQLYISVTNAMAADACHHGERLLSRKGENHGFGLWRIDSIVAKHGGCINRQTENGVFATEVTLPLLQEK